MAHHFDLPPGSIVAIDRGYNDFRLFARWIAGGVFFVTRPMRHMVYEVVESRQPPQNSNILSDAIIRFTSKKARQTFKYRLLSQANWSFSNLATMLRLNLFTYRDLRDWLHNPFGTPPIVPGPQQLALSLA
jgi:hypothetical protein